MGAPCTVIKKLQEFDGKKLKSTTKEGLDIEDEDEKPGFGIVLLVFRFCLKGC